MDLVLPEIGLRILNNSQLTYKLWLTLPFKLQYPIYKIWFLCSPIFHIAVFLTMVAPFLFLYLLYSENGFTNYKLGPITFLLCESIAFLFLSVYGEYAVMGSLVSLVRGNLGLYYNLILISIVLLLLVFFIHHLYKLDYEAYKKRTAELLNRKKVRRK
jgi:hypothetical protein